MNPSSKGVLVSFLILGVGLYTADSRPKNVVILVAAASIVALMAVVNRIEKSGVKEIIISGIILSSVEAYHFLVQPQYPSLPQLSPQGELFFGVAILIRAVLVLLEYVKSPLQPYVQKVIGK